VAIDWEGVKRDFLAGGKTFRELSDEYGCHPDTIRKRARREGWSKPGSEDGKTGQGPAGSGKKRDDITGTHRHLWRGVKKRLQRGLKSRDLKLGLEELKVAKVAGEVLTHVVRGEREVWGLNDNDGEGVPEEIEEIVKEMAALTAPSGTDETLE